MSTTLVLFRTVSHHIPKGRGSVIIGKHVEFPLFNHLFLKISAWICNCINNQLVCQYVQQTQNIITTNWKYPFFLSHIEKVVTKRCMDSSNEESLQMPFVSLWLNRWGINSLYTSIPAYHVTQGIFLIPVFYVHRVYALHILGAECGPWPLGTMDAPTCDKETRIIITLISSLITLSPLMGGLYIVC